MRWGLRGQNGVLETFCIARDGLNGADMDHDESRDAMSNVSSTWPRRISGPFSRPLQNWEDCVVLEGN